MLTGEMRLQTMTSDRVYYSHDTEMQAMRGRAALTMIFLTLGLAIGVGLALLFAPTSGKKARHDLTKSVEQGVKDGREALEPVVKRVEKEFSELQKNVEEHLK
jgi:gas vesicle protein